MDPSINYVQKGKGIPFVFQHGLGANITQAKSLFAPLKNVTFISMDCPGHGASPISATFVPSFDYYANQLLSLLDYLKVKEAIFGGISMGAGIALNIALRFPERVNALVLVRPAWADKGKPENLAILLEVAKNMGKQNGVMVYKENPVFKHIEKTLPLAAQSLLGLFDPSQSPEFPRVLQKMVEDRPFEDIAQLQKINKPCLIIGNDHDPLHPFEMAEHIHQNIPESRLSKVASRYLDESEHAKSVNQLVSTFIATL
ncbi:MAG: alpha/beta hydrolase [Bacteroidetes bacterium]|nr:alpha/beta hydrolase [Bacteroidota bacterium]MDA1120137.1 alpha/beta hydrolase [Bacteroidota bacterium]